MGHIFKKSIVAQFVTATLFAASIQATYAQQQNSDEQADELEVINIIGIRNSLAENLNRKRLSDTFTDAIVAEDIGKLPDDNLAETLQRVAGIQIEKEDGEGTGVTIRGIRENRIEVNGRTLISPFGRGTNENLMNYFPSEIVGAVEVSKVLTADMSDGALGGTINITTRKPLDKPGLWGGISAEGSYAELDGDDGIKLSGLVSNSFNDDTFGVMVGFVHEDRSITEDRFSTNGDWRSQTKVFNNPDNFTAEQIAAVPSPFYYTYDLRYQRKYEDRNKTAANVAIEWLATDDLSISADLLYAESESDRSRTWVGAILDKELDDDHVPLSWVFSDTDSRVAGDIQNGVIQQNAEGAQRPEDFLTGGINATWDAPSGLRVFTEIAFTESNSTFDQQYIQLNNTGNSFSYDFRSSDIPEVALPASVADRSILTGATVYDRRTANEAKETSFRIDLDYPLDGNITAVKAGIKLSSIEANRYKIAKRGESPLVDGVDDPARPFFTRDFSTAEVTSFNRMKLRTGTLLDGTDPNFAWATNAAVNFDLSGVLPSANLTNLPSSMWIIDTHLIGNGGLGFSDTFYDKAFERIPWEDSNVEDSVNAIYVRADFDISGWQGNVGLRYARTTTDVNKFVNVAGAFQAFSDQGDYSDVLPSIVVKRDLTDDLVLRLGASKTIARPKTSNYQKSDNIVVRVDDPETPEDESDDSTASIANSDLLPQRGVQYDVSLEWYFAKTSALAVAAFYKEIDNQVINDGKTGTLPGFGDQVFNITTTVNGGGGDITGFEVAFQHNFQDMPVDFLNNVGTSLNYTYLDNATDAIDPRTGEQLGIRGVSENSVNIQLFYEDESLSARLLYNWRDDYFDRLDPFSSTTAITNRGEPSLDAALRYNFSDNFTVEFQALNLLDSPKKEYALNDIAQYGETGTRYSLGASYRF